MAKRAKKKSRPPEPFAAAAASAISAVAPKIPAAAPRARVFRRRREVGPNFADIKVILRSALIIVVGFWIYLPALNGDWLWDDRDLIIENVLVHDPNGLWKIWFEPTSLFDYLPLKVSVEWIEWRIWGDQTLGYHLVNVGLHLVSAFLLWRLLRKFGLRNAWLGGMIFAVHPIMVESVAWISELKNTLSLPFFLLAMGAWIDYDAQERRRDYALALGLFLLALLAKPTMVMFPVVILLHAWWRRNRLGWRDLKRSAPFFAVSLAIGLTTIWFLGRTIGEQNVVLGGVLSRLACAGLSISFYFSKCVLPLDLMAVYPRWILDPPSPIQFLPWLAIGSFLYYLWTKRGGWGRNALLGVGFFLINLAPFLGLNAASYMTFTWVMDHVLYIPIIGLIGLTVAACGQLEAQLSVPLRWAGGAVLGILLALSAWTSHGYAKLYVNLQTLWTYNIAHNPSGALPHNDLGYAFVQQGRIPEAIEQMRLATELDPTFRDAHHNLGLLLLQTGHVAEALREFQTLLRLSPNLPEAYYNVALALDGANRAPEAIEYYRQAIALNPGYMDAYNNLAVDLVRQNRLPEAAQVFQAALQVGPDDVQIQNNLTRLLQAQKRPPAPKRGKDGRRP